MNEFERAVIEAARSRVIDGQPGAGIALERAVAALDEHEKQQRTAGVQEVPWHRVAEGDMLRSKSGKFFPVTATKRQIDMGKPTGKYLITVQLPGTPKVLTRPNGVEPMAVVRRGATGEAIEQFVNVFSSGG